MHIAFVINDLGGGGAERVVLSLTAGLIGQGHRVDLVLLEGGIRYAKDVPCEARLFVLQRTPVDPEDPAADVLQRAADLRGSPRPLDWIRFAIASKWDPLCMPSARLARQARAIASYMKREKPDCVLPNVPRAVTATLFGSRLLDAVLPIVPIIHAVGQSRLPRHHRRYRRLLPYATRCVGVSQGVSDDLAVTARAPRHKITTIYNPVVTQALHAKTAEPPSHPWLIDYRTPVILAAGRLTEQKDFPTLIRAFARLIRQRPTRLIILGEGPLRQELEGLAQDLGIDDRVSFPGWVDNPFALMSRASLFVLSSIYEGLPTVLVEAMACGCPCVSTDCPSGPAEILEDGRYGPLVPVGDEAALAEAMERGLDEPPDRSLLQQRAAYFSADRAVAAYEDLIASVLQCASC